MSEGKLFISFWDICLENLPEGGAFTRRRITSDAAKLCIEQAQKGQTLLCLTDDDLLAPYCERQRKNHEALCDILRDHFGIDLSLRDFCSKDDDSALYFINSLNFARVKAGSPLLVVNCGYSFPKLDLEGDGMPISQIEPSSVEFDLIECI
jgi:hypothetical protein